MRKSKKKNNKSKKVVLYGMILDESRNNIEHKKQPFKNLEIKGKEISETKKQTEAFEYIKKLAEKSYSKSVILRERAIFTISCDFSNNKNLTKDGVEYEIKWNEQILNNIQSSSINSKKYKDSLSEICSLLDLHILTYLNEKTKEIK